MSRESRKGHTTFRKDRCERCGTRQDRRALAVHHKDGDNSNDDPENLETLCDSCHMRTHFLGKPIPEVTKKKLSEKNKGLGNPYYGKTHTATIRQKMKGPRGQWWTRPDGTAYISPTKEGPDDTMGRPTWNWWTTPEGRTYQSFEPRSLEDRRGRPRKAPDLSDLVR